ncbi:sulfotransferase [Flammeovirga sp. EKP202]|uniref:sulfotransferase n=1 Tax=Flammeovirga sp. EKP202 TaxID=2770592 RepID=UPI00165F7A73|nr:sulfotransferase [Flammeovirga sp. EKP202]MBD0400836.1 sulfotransferase [Flammeovirga sp. EKP202]
MNQPIIIIGMHRSGTTFLSEILEDNGVFMGSNNDPNNEPFFFLEQNERALLKEGASWDNPLPIDELTLGLIGRIKFVKNYLGLKGISSIFANSNWGWKDPRNSFTIEGWLKFFPNAKVVHIYRNGIDVARSLQTRNKILAKNGITHYSQSFDSLSNCFKLWEIYVEKCLNFTDSYANSINICYDKLIHGDQKAIDDINLFLGINIRETVLNKVDQSKRKKTEYSLEERDIIANSKLLQKLYRINNGK